MCLSPALHLLCASDGKTKGFPGPAPFLHANLPKISVPGTQHHYCGAVPWMPLVHTSGVHQHCPHLVPQPLHPSSQTPSPWVLSNNASEKPRMCSDVTPADRDCQILPRSVHSSNRLYEDALKGRWKVLGSHYPCEDAPKEGEGHIIPVKIPGGGCHIIPTFAHCEWTYSSPVFCHLCTERAWQALTMPYSVYACSTVSLHVVQCHTVPSHGM